MDNQPTRYEALLACRDAAGSNSQMGRDLDIPQSTMSRIINSSRQLPAEYVLTAERLYGVSRHALRPDIYPRETMQDRRAMRACELATGQNDTVPCHDVQHSDRFHGVDFKRGFGTKAAGQ